MNWRQLALGPAAVGGALFFYHLGTRSWGWVALGAALALGFSLVWIGVPLPRGRRRGPPKPRATHPSTPPGNKQHGE